MLLSAEKVTLCLLFESEVHHVFKPSFLVQTFTLGFSAPQHPWEGSV